MKRFYPMLMALLASFVLAAPVFAYRDADFADLPFDGADSGAVTVLTDTQGAVHRYDGALDAAAPEEYPAVAAKIASYAVELDGETLLTVELRDFEAAPAARAPLLGAGASVLTNGFYAVTFDYDASYECFVTGLDSDQVSELQAALINAKLSYATVNAATLAELSFIDAEKLATVDTEDTLRYSNDSRICWAATTANLLYYTGWAKQTNSELDEDDLLDLFAENFEDGFGNVYYGTIWFFNGRYAPDDEPDLFNSETWANKKPDAEGGNYLRYRAEDYLDYVTINNNLSAIRNVLNSLRGGDGVGVSLGWYDYDAEADIYERNGGHAITLWGYIRAKGEDDGDFDPSSYVALLTTDSDSDPVNNKIKNQSQKSTDRRGSPDCLALMPLTPISINAEDEGATQTVESWQVQATEGESKQLGLLTDFVVLKAFSESYQPDQGTFNFFTSPDLAVESLYIGEGEQPFRDGIRSVFTANRELYVSIWDIANNGAVPYPSNDIPYAVSLSKDGEPFADIEQQGRCYLYGYDSFPATARFPGGVSDQVSLGALEAGSYTVRVSLAADAVRDAYYTNNVMDMHFTVTEQGYDLSGAALAVAGMSQVVGTGKYGDLYQMPLAVTGAPEELTAEKCYATVEQLFSDGWFKTGNGTAESIDRINVPLENVHTAFRASILVKPANTSMPWPVLEGEFAVIQYSVFYDKSEGNEYYYIGGEYDLLDRTIAPWSSWSDSVVYAAGYDAAGRMVSFAQSTDGSLVRLSDGVSSVRLFWLDEDGKPKALPIDIKI